VSCVTQIVLADSGGQLWSVQMSDAGTAIVAKIASGTAETRILADFTGSNTAWQIGVTTLGALTTTRVSFQENYPALIQFDTTPGGLPYQLLVTNTGTLQSLGPQAANVIVGQLLNFPASNPYKYGNFTQPGGPGNPVFPGQTQEEHNGRYMLGCTHSVNSVNVVRWQIQPCVIMLLACCPICSWIQAVVDPETFYDSGDPLIV
jgi:hypothetical protein